MHGSVKPRVQPQNEAAVQIITVASTMITKRPKTNGTGTQSVTQTLQRVIPSMKVHGSVAKKTSRRLIARPTVANNWHRHNQTGVDKQSVAENPVRNGPGGEPAKHCCWGDDEGSPLANEPADCENRGGDCSNDSKLLSGLCTGQGQFEGAQCGGVATHVLDAS